MYCSGVAKVFVVEAIVRPAYRVEN